MSIEVSIEYSFAAERMDFQAHLGSCVVLKVSLEIYGIVQRIEDVPDAILVKAESVAGDDNVVLSPVLFFDEVGKRLPNAFNLFHNFIVLGFHILFVVSSVLAA